MELNLIIDPGEETRKGEALAMDTNHRCTRAAAATREE